jgi:preprotein translocase subunit SecA
VTYCTNKDVAADFLRDRLALGRTRRLPPALFASLTQGRGAGADRLLMRGLETAVIDEADSVLIDEAVTPLIISADSPNAEREQAFLQAAGFVRRLRQGVDFRVDARHRELTLTRAGRELAREIAQPLGGVWAGARRREELITQALTASVFYLRDQQYVVEEGKVVIVDESTGRLMPDRTWRDGMHQAVEAKEGLTVNTPKETLARISFQRFFRMYRRLCGMTGTAWEARHELWQVYHLKTCVIPTHRPRQREQWPDRVFATQSAKWEAAARHVAEVHATGRPVLVGTRTVEESERLSLWLSELKLPHQVLNAIRHKEEAEVVAQAGGRGRITVATNMAGRGTDIKLASGVAELGGLHVLATTRHSTRRVDRQLSGRAGRQGDPGSAAAFVSLEDDLLQRYAGPAARRLTRRLAGRAQPLQARSLTALIARCQDRAERLARQQRRSVLRSDDWVSEFLGFAGAED